MTDLNLRIREVRKQRGWTLAELAERVGCSIPHMSDLERGRKSMTNNTLASIAEALGVEPWELIADPETAAFTRAFQGLSPEDQARVRSFVDGLRATYPGDGQDG